DGTGWIPINFTQLVTVNLPALPIDPLNNTTYYFTYTTGGSSYELTALLESSERQKIAEEDGGINLFSYEIGTDLSLLSMDPSLSISRDPRFEISAIPNDTNEGTFGYWTFGSWSGYNHELNIVQRPDGSTGKVLKITKIGAAGGEDMFDYIWKDKTILGQQYKWCVYARGEGGIVHFASHWGSLGSFTPTLNWQHYCVNFTRGGTINNYNYFKFDNINNWVELWFTQIIPLN
ncbi:MAG: hypothetical protein PHD96_02285, partial [Candidatus Pacebacteria bacterium]|nr:hypothetical protein [Candidatus Paceibacterota bacterium]